MVAFVAVVTCGCERYLWITCGDTKVYLHLCVVDIHTHLLHGNILGANQSLRANYENLNLSHRINIQGEGRGGWEGGFAEV